MQQFGMGIDKHARLFKYEDKILRAIQPKYTDFYRKIIAEKVIKDLIADNIFIQTEVSPISIDGFELVLEHPLLPFVSYPFEWTPSMFKDAALNILKINLSLANNGLFTQDAHPWNILFDGTSPKYVDFTSIIPFDTSRANGVLQEFNSYCMNSLLLMAKGHLKTFRVSTHEIFSYPDMRLVNELYEPKLTLHKMPQILWHKIALRVVNYLGNRINTDEPLTAIKRLIEEIEALDVRPKASEWSSYYSGENELPIYDGSMEVLNTIRTATAKHALIDQLLEKINPRTVLDIGCNRGLYSQIAASRGAKVIGIDMDEQALDQMYHDSKAAGSYVLPLYINAVAPVEAIGFKEIPFPHITERLKSECVLCLAFVHHLVFKKYQMDFMHIARLLSSYSNKYLIVEFIPKEDKHVSKWYIDEYSWYNIENFKTALHQYFNKIEIFESFPAPRKILFCQK